MRSSRTALLRASRSASFRSAWRLEELLGEAYGLSRAIYWRRRRGEVVTPLGEGGGGRGERGNCGADGSRGDDAARRGVRDAFCGGVRGDPGTRGKDATRNMAMGVSCLAVGLEGTRRTKAGHGRFFLGCGGRYDYQVRTIIACLMTLFGFAKDVGWRDAWWA